MTQTRATRTVTVVNPGGLHLRAASLIAELTGRVPAKVELIKGNKRVDATDVLQIVLLCAFEGDQLLLEATGQHADAVLETLSALFENSFDEDKLGTSRQGRQAEHNPGETSRSDAPCEGDRPSA